MHHQPQEKEKKKRFPYKKTQNFDTKAQSNTQFMDDLKA